MQPSYKYVGGYEPINFDLKLGNDIISTQFSIIDYKRDILSLAPLLFEDVEGFLFIFDPQDLHQIEKIKQMSELLDDFKKELYDICRHMVELEDKFLDLVFDMGDIQGLTKKDMYAYNRYIADRRLLQLGLKTNYDQRENPLGWLDEVMGVEHQNFFEGRATSYMKAGLRGRQDKITFANLESDNG